jgi:hypothetical protein
MPGSATTGIAHAGESPVVPADHDRFDVAPLATLALHSDLGMIEMAKPKAKPGRGRPAVEEESSKTLGRRVSGTYLERTTRAASANRSRVSGLIDQAVVKDAREIGVTDPPPDRTARFTLPRMH